jgi:hypothetical protein
VLECAATEKTNNIGPFPRLPELRYPYLPTSASRASRYSKDDIWLSIHSPSDAGTTIKEPQELENIISTSDASMEGRTHLDVCVCSTNLSSTHPSSHHKPTPRRRNEHMPWLRHRPIQTTHLLLLIFLTCCLSFSSATVYIQEQMVEAQDDGPEVLGSGSATELADSGTLLVDPAWTPERLHAIHGDLKRRNDHTSSSISSTSTVSTTATTTVASSSTTAAATPLATSQLPTPLDIGFSNNITASCQSFMTSMLTSSNFTACLPFSLLLQVRSPIASLLDNI